MSPRLPVLFASLALLAGVPATGQMMGQSEGAKFLSAVKDGKGSDVVDMVEKPGSEVINARGYSDGEGALHIVVRRGDSTYLRYLLQHGADPNIRDDKGVTPLLLAVSLGQDELVPLLLAGNANPNQANSSGETPLIRAVQRRDVEAARVLLNNGADPDQRDILAGMSAREYAARDARNQVLARLLADAPKRAARAGVAGPKF